jgi:hypothetical protein
VVRRAEQPNFVLAKGLRKGRRPDRVAALETGLGRLWPARSRGESGPPALARGGVWGLWLRGTEGEGTGLVGVGRGLRRIGPAGRARDQIEGASQNIEALAP